MTKFRYYNLADAVHARGVVVVIDVLRAFTTAAFALANGAREIYPVANVVEALNLRSDIPGSAVMGEVDGFKPEGFDFSNSPTEISHQDLSGRTMIQRTSAGTQGVLRTTAADVRFAASFVVARSTALKIRQLDPDLVSFIVTGESLGRDGDEDLACGQYIESLIRNQNPDPVEFISRIETSSVGQSFLNGEVEYFLYKDIVLSKQVNRFEFYLPIIEENDRLVIRKGMI